MIPVLTAGHAALVGEELFVSEFHNMIAFSFYIRRYKAAETQMKKSRDLMYARKTMESKTKPHLRLLPLIDPVGIP